MKIGKVVHETFKRTNTLYTLHAFIFAFAVLLLATPARSQNYSNWHVTKVGIVQVSGSTNGGVTVWFTKDGSAFPGCTQQASAMWTAPQNEVTEGARKSMLAILLTAKPMDSNVLVYYYVDSSGYCRGTHLAIY